MGYPVLTLCNLVDIREKALKQQTHTYRIDRSNACAAGALSPTAGSLTGFVVTVSCVQTVHDDGGTPRAVYALNAFAQYAQFGSADYVSAREARILVR